MKIVFDSESELEQYIFDAYDMHGHMIVDQTEPDTLVRQMNLSPYGVADLVSFIFCRAPDESVHIAVTVYELKKEQITASAFAQAYRYLTAIENTVQSLYPACEFVGSVALVGTSIDESCFMLNHTNAYFYKVFFNLESGVDFEDLSDGWARECSSISSVVDALNYVSQKPNPNANEKKGFGFE